MQRDSPTGSELSSSFFLPSRRATVVFALLLVAAFGLALFVRYEIVQNTPIGLACETGEKSLTCTVRLAAILLFVRGAFGWTALAAAAVQLWRPNVVVFGIGLVAAALGLVLYNTRLSALAIALLVLSLARGVREGRRRKASGASPRTKAPANSRSPH